MLVRRRADGTVADVTPPDHNVRTRVHEYGGGAYVVRAALSITRILRTSGSIGSAGAATPTGPPPITPEGKWFYADAKVDERRRRLICVREDHTHEGHEPSHARLDSHRTAIRAQAT